MSLLFLLFTLASCDFNQARLCWFCVSCTDKIKKEKSPWLKSKEKTVLRKRRFSTKDGEKLLPKPIKAASWFNKSSLLEDDQLPGGGYSGIFWVGMFRSGLQIWTPF